MFYFNFLCKPPLIKTKWRSYARFINATVCKWQYVVMNQRKYDFILRSKAELLLTTFACNIKNVKKSHNFQI